MQISPGWQRVIAGAAILPAAAVSLPLAATFLDHPPGRENWIFPAQAGGMAAIGAGLGAAMPNAFGGSRGKAMAIGAGVAVGAALLADIALFGLITDRGIVSNAAAR